MNRLAISQAAAALLKALVARSGAARDRILLIDASLSINAPSPLPASVSSIELRVLPPHLNAIANAMCARLENARLRHPECDCRGYRRCQYQYLSADGSTNLTIEALTVAND